MEATITCCVRVLDAFHGSIVSAQEFLSSCGEVVPAHHEETASQEIAAESSTTRNEFVSAGAD